MRAHEQTIYGNTQHTTHWKTITVRDVEDDRELKRQT